MKKILFLLAVCLSTIAVQAQTKTYTVEEANKLDTLAQRMFKQNRFEDCINVLNRHLEALKQLRGEADSLYIQRMILLGRSYYHNQQAEEAVKTMKQCAKLYEKYHPSDLSNYAFVLDNAELYLGSLGRSKEGEQLGRKALAAYEKVGSNDHDMATILIHLAENCSTNGHHKDAIAFELRALGILRTLMGEHSEEYLAELPYLQSYYAASGDAKNADRVEKRIERLQQERDQGHADLPDPVEFATPEECRNHNDDMQRCCNYLFTHTLQAMQIKQAMQYIISWTSASPDVTIEVSDSISQLFGRTETVPFGIAYLAAASLYCLQYNKHVLDEEGFVAACDLVVSYYEHNKKIVGVLEPLESWLKANKDGALADMMRREYNESIVKEREKNETDGEPTDQEQQETDGEAEAPTSE
ncbi:MAG: tetratricopeptide repeat protein [Prevotella sp.]|nr:tetratricopeptide repeat protein [Prevotella sp.]